jgi:predicted permease
MHGLIAAQVAFCFLVIFVAGLFVATFEGISHQPTGFSSERIVNLQTVTSQAQPAVYWEEVQRRLASMPGVETVAISSWPLLSGNQSNSFLAIGGGPVNPTLAFILSVSPGWADAMKIPFIDGRDFRTDDAEPGTAIVNERFAKTFFNGENPVGKSFEKTYPKRTPTRIVGFVRDARYSDMHQEIRPMVYVPFRRNNPEGAAQPVGSGNFVVKTTSQNPLVLANALRAEVRAARSEFRVTNIRTQEEINRSNMVRERLLAALAFFFAAVALLLAGIGLYGVLNYSVVEQRREIGIRLAIGAPGSTIARLVTVRVFTMVIAGAVIGVAGGLASARYIETLFYKVKATDPRMIGFAGLTILSVALLAAVPAVVHAVRIDPVKTLRSE